MSGLRQKILTRRAAMMLSYTPDWIMSLTIGGLFFVIGNMSGFKRAFSLTDISIQYPYAVHERISNTNLALIAFVAPLLLMPLVNVLTVRSFWDWHHSSLGLVCATAFTGTLTCIVKIAVGRPRPDAIDRCQPLPGSADHPVYGLVTAAICTQTDEAIMKDGWKSFFSGHSSLSFAGLGFMSFYLAGKLHLFDKRGHVGKAWLSMTPLAGATLVAISRTMDYRHHWEDVVVGSIVGLTFAYFSYRQYYPALKSENCHLPYRPRVDQFLRPSLLPQHAGPTSLHSLQGLPEERERYRDREEEADIHEALETDRTLPDERVPVSDFTVVGDSSNASSNR